MVGEVEIAKTGTQEREQQDVAGSVRALVGRIERVAGGELDLEEVLRIEARFIGLRRIAEETPGTLDPHLEALREARTRFERLKAPLAVRIVDELYRVRGVIRNIEEREVRLREALVWLSRTSGHKAVQGVEAQAEVTAAAKLRVPPSGTPGRIEVERIVRDAGAWGRVSVLYGPWLEKALRTGAFRGEARKRLETLCPKRTAHTIRVRSRGSYGRK